MSDLTRFGVPLGDGKRGGILMPAQQHRFRVTFRDSHLFTSSVAAVQFSYTTKTISVDVREDPAGELHEVIHAVEPTDTFVLEVLDGSDGVLRTMIFSGLRLERATSEWSYASAHPVIQRVELSFHELTLLRGK
jgi:hypothetical protein